MPPHTNWKRVNENRWVRRDGAVVKWDLSSPYPNPEVPSSRLWSAWEPDPGERYLSYRRRNSTFNIKRRWRTAEAAMEAVDLEMTLPDTNGTTE